MIEYNTVLAIAAASGANPVALADALRGHGYDVEQPADGVTKRAREISAQFWEVQGCYEVSKDARSGGRDGIDDVQCARAAILDDLAIVERVRALLERPDEFAKGYWFACDAITAAMKGEA